MDLHENLLFVLWFLIGSHKPISFYINLHYWIYMIPLDLYWISHVNTTMDTTMNTTMNTIEKQLKI
jgi:hypothetical protein